MTIIVTGVTAATGQIGSLLAAELAQRGAAARLLTTAPDKHEFPEGMTPVKGDLIKSAAMQRRCRLS